MIRGLDMRYGEDLDQTDIFMILCRKEGNFHQTFLDKNWCILNRNQFCTDSKGRDMKYGEDLARMVIYTTLSNRNENNPEFLDLAYTMPNL